MTAAKICAILLAAAITLAPAPAAAANSGCTVNPNPIVENQPWTVTAHGLTPNGHYWMKINQANDPSNNAHPNSTMTADSLGDAVVAFAGTNVSPDLILRAEYGNGSIAVYPDRWWGDAAGRASCRFTVVKP